MRLAIVTINYNGSENTIKLLKSFQGQIDRDFEVIVIDNASEEVCLNNLESTMGTMSNDMVPMVRVRMIRNEENLGFSGGNNIGIKKALENGSDWVVLLNNDTWVERDFIGVLRAKLNELGGVVGIPLVEDNRTAYCGKVEWLKSTLMHHYNGHHCICNGAHCNVYAIGGALAIHKEVFEKTGFLDEKYFLYFEDADFSLRAQKAGLSLNFLDKPKVHHQVSSSTKKLGSPLLLRYHCRNALYFNLKNGPWHIKILVWPWSFWIMKKQLLKMMFMYKQEESLAILKGIFDFYRNKMGRI